MRRTIVPALGLGFHDVPTRRRLRGRAGLVILIGLALAPVVYEVAALSAARWSSLYGPQRAADTRTLDALSRGASTAYNGVTRAAMRPLRYLPWKPGWVVGAGGMLVALGFYLLRRL